MYVFVSDHNQAGTDMTAVHHDCCKGSCQNVHGSSMSMHPLVFPHGADTQAHADADADVKALTISANGDTGAHQGAEGPRVGVEACGDWGPQSCTTAQQVGSLLNTLVSVAQSYYGMHLFKFAVVTWSESGVVMHMHVYHFDACKSVTLLQ